MKKIIFLLVVLFMANTIHAQDIINPYADYLNYSHYSALFGTAYHPVYENTTYPSGPYYWESPMSGDISGNYNGEYQIYLGRIVGELGQHYWWSHTEGPSSSYKASYTFETVSFPFTMDCAFIAAGCTSSSTDRFLYLPDDADLDAGGEWWNYPTVTNFADKLYRITPLDGQNKFNDGNISTPGHTLVSAPFSSGGNGVDRRVFPHTVLKVTLNFHCGTDIQNNDIISSFSFLYDNTRGRMRYYPFFNNNNLHPSGTEQYYDLIFRPELLVGELSGLTSGSHAYDYSVNDFIMDNGTLNYFPYSEIVDWNCSVNNTFSDYPQQTDVFFSGSFGFGTFSYAYPAPYTLISAPLRSDEGGHLAGYTAGSGGYAYLATGLRQDYFIDKNINLANINPIEKIIYNPSEAYITATANDLRFPEGYIFKTIRGQYPSVSDVTADDIAENGGPFADPRDVPVTTDVFYVGPNGYPANDHDYASVYIMQSGSKLTVEGCVYIFDATFDCNTGSELVFENFPTNKNLERFKIEYDGGTVTKRANDFYFQDDTEDESILRFESDGPIRAGDHVNNTIAYGSYTVDPGADVTFVSTDEITLEDGFTAVSGTNFIATIASVTVPTCTPPQFRKANHNYNAEGSENSDDLQIITIPNPTPGIFGLQLKNGSTELKEIYVTDMFGKKIMTVENNKRSKSIIDLSSYPKGVYFVKVIENNRTAVAKIVKM